LRVGDWVDVAKAGEIIPAIVGVHQARRSGRESEVVFPEECPSCAEPLDRAPDRAAWYCVNARCPAQLVRRLAHFASSAALDIRGLGPALLETMVAHGVVQEPADLYALEAEDLQALPGVGPTLATRLVEAIASSRDVGGSEGTRVLIGLGLPGVGRTTARQLAASFVGMAALIEADEGALLAAGLGPATAAALWDYLARPDVRDSWERLQEQGIGQTWARPGEKVTVSRKVAGPLAGETVVVTGRLLRWTRPEISRVLEAAGARVGSSVTSATTLLVSGEDPGASLARARERGVVVIDEAELVRRLGER
jgi:DNA ligase (NAD+)